MAQSGRQALPTVQKFVDRLNIKELRVGHPEESSGGRAGGLFSLFGGGGGGREHLNAYSMFSEIPNADKKAFVEEQTRAHTGIDRAVGSMIGMGIGDHAGHPFEFISVKAVEEAPKRRPHFILADKKWYNESNAFRLQRGQWTDDASMGLCMADSLIVRRQYDGSDMRTRFWNWWNCGYNNAFRNEEGRSSSVGLGGNIGKSLYSLQTGQVPPPRFQADNEDSGNGSLMRAAPVPIFFHSNMDEARQFAKEQSFTTHPGNIAAEACSLHAYVIVTAMNHEGNPGDNVKAFLEETTAAYSRMLEQEVAELLAGDGDVEMKDAEAEAAPDAGDAEEEKADAVGEAPAAVTGGHVAYEDMSALERKIFAKRLVMRLIRSEEPDESKERNWNWKAELGDRGILRALDNRGRRYNGYPVSGGYWGAYSMDGLAAALHSVYHSTSLGNCVEICINLLGDADSTGSIAGQMAGAIFGYQSLASNEAEAFLLQQMEQWDDGEFAFRGVLLYVLGEQRAAAAASAAPAEGAAAEEPAA